MVRLERLEPREATPKVLFATYLKVGVGPLTTFDNLTEGYQLFRMVRLEGLEPPRPKALEPKSSVSTNFTTAAYRD